MDKTDKKGTQNANNCPYLIWKLSRRQCKIILYNVYNYAHSMSTRAFAPKIPSKFTLCCDFFGQEEPTCKKTLPTNNIARQT